MLKNSQASFRNPCFIHFPLFLRFWIQKKISAYLLRGENVIITRPILGIREHNTYQQAQNQQCTSHGQPGFFLQQPRAKNLFVCEWHLLIMFHSSFITASLWLLYSVLPFVVLFFKLQTHTCAVTCRYSSKEAAL